MEKSSECISHSGRLGYGIYNLLLAPIALLGRLYLFLHPRYHVLLDRFKPKVDCELNNPIWIHSCSVGEVSVAYALVNGLKKKFSETPVLITTSTVSGREHAKRVLPEVPVAWFPFDTRTSIEFFFKQVTPSILVLSETEIWPNVIGYAWQRKIPVAIINGRLSDKHFSRFLFLSRWFPDCFRNISLAAMQNNEYKERAKRLGMKEQAIHVTGNIKYDSVGDCVTVEQKKLFRDENAIKQDAFVIVFGCTRPGEEELAKRCLLHLQQKNTHCVCILVPRHLERVNSIRSMLGSACLLRSDIKQKRPEQNDHLFILVDTMGELTQFYSIADVAIVGGSFFKGIHGHNPLEPASQGVPVLFGPFMRNNADAADDLLARGGAISVSDYSQLCNTLDFLMQNKQKREEMGQAALDTVRAGRGSTKRTVSLLSDLLEGKI